MHNKYNSKSNNFTQGLKPFWSSIPKTLKKYLRKGGYNYSNVVDNWAKIVNKKVSDASYPISIKMGKEMKNGTLILNVIHGNELNIEYKKQEILEKINSFFGFNYIEEIKLKVVHEKREVSSNYRVSKLQKEKYNKKLENIKNKDLKKSLNKLIEAYNNKNE